MRIAEIPTGEGERIVVETFNNDAWVSLLTERYTEWGTWSPDVDAQAFLVHRSSIAPLIAALQKAAEGET